MEICKGLYRRNGKNVYIKQPEYRELEFVSKLWSDRETMKDIGGTFFFPENKWEMFYKKMVQPTDGKNFYCLIYTTKDIPVGEVSFHGYDSATKIARFNVKIHCNYRNRGYAEEAIRLILEYYFLEFGGEVIMDNIYTVQGFKLAKKLGFKEVGTYKGGTTVKITKESFFSNNKGDSKKVALLMYDGMSSIDSSVFCEILNLANDIADDRIFNINQVAFKDELNISTNFKFKVENEISNEKIDILVIPDGKNITAHVEDENYIKYIMDHFNECEYVCSSGEGIKFLIKCNALEGIFVPKSQVGKHDREFIGNNRLVLKNFVDNGKIMLSANLMGQIELVLAIIDKVAGRDLAEKVAHKIGLN